MASSKSGGKTPGKKTQSVWHKSAPQCVRVLDRKIDGKNDRDVEAYKNAQKAWAKHLRKRKDPLPLSKLLPGKTHPLSWALPRDFMACASVAETSADVARFDNARFDPADEEQIRQWLECGPGEEDGSALVHALEALAWCHALPRLGESDVWWELLERLVSMAVDAEALTPVEDGMLSQLAGGELPLTLAYLFPEINVCRQLARQARAVLSVGLIDMLDGQGLPPGRELDMLRPLLACWTRCQAMGATMKKGCFNSAAEDQYQWLIRQALRMARPDGSQVFSQPCDGTKDETIDIAARCCRDLFTSALLFGDDDDRDIAGTALPKWFKKPDMQELPEAAYHSEWASTSVLRPDWSAGGARLTARFDGRAGVDIELSCGKSVVFSGPWQWQISAGGKSLEPLSDWEEICWVSDEDADYLELEMALTEDVILQRHILMAREDGFLLLADSVLCDEETAKKPKIEYRAGLPLGPEITFEPAEETHEAMLTSKKKNLAQILPLAFPEWRESPSSGSLKETNDGLELKFSTKGNALFAPLFFDLDPRRFARRMTWRRLTIAESLEKQPADVAVGYRVQLGKEQWLIYRSLAQQANRTLLGHNLSTEMLVARFDPTGEVEALVEIE